MISKSFDRRPWYIDDILLGYYYIQPNRLDLAASTLGESVYNRSTNDNKMWNTIRIASKVCTELHIDSEKT